MKIVPITENHLFSKAYSKGKRQAAHCVTVYVLRDLHASRLKKENPQKKKVNRVGITVTKKLCGAVMRSRVRRIIREAYIQTDKETPIRKGYLVVIVAKEKATGAMMQDIKKDLAYAFRRLDMLEGEAKETSSEDKSL